MLFFREGRFSEKENAVTTPGLTEGLHEVVAERLRSRVDQGWHFQKEDVELVGHVCRQSKRVTVVAGMTRCARGDKVHPARVHLARIEFDVGANDGAVRQAATVRQYDEVRAAFVPFDGDDDARLQAGFRVIDDPGVCCARDRVLDVQLFADDFDQLVSERSLLAAIAPFERGYQRTAVGQANGLVSPQRVANRDAGVLVAATQSSLNAAVETAADLGELLCIVRLREIELQRSIFPDQTGWTWHSYRLHGFSLRLSVAMNGNKFIIIRFTVICN